MPNKITAIIPVAGMGRRMKSYGPKSLLRVNGETILFRQIRLLRSVFGRPQIIIVAGFDGAKIKASLPSGLRNTRVIYNKNYETTNVAESIRLGMLKARRDKCLIVYGDLFFNTEALQPFGNHERSAVLVDSIKQPQMRPEEVGINVVDGRATHFAYTLTRKWCQIALLCDEEKRLFLDDLRTQERRYGYEILNRVLQQGGSLDALSPANTNIVEIDSSKDLKYARSCFGYG